MRQLWPSHLTAGTVDVWLQVSMLLCQSVSYYIQVEDVLGKLAGHPSCAWKIGLVNYWVFVFLPMLSLPSVVP